MAFTAELPQPGRIPVGRGPSESGLGALGGILTGVADIGDKIATHLQAADAAKTGNDVANQLTDLTRENFGQTPQGDTAPQLAGEGPSDPRQAAAASSPIVRGTLGQLDRLHQANKQGSLSPTELMTRGSVIVQDAINANPMYAQEIRQAAQSVLGTQPTQELVKLAEEDSTRQIAMAQQVKMDSVMTAVKSGITYLNQDGTPDYDKTAAAGQQVAFADKQMSDALRIAQLNAAKQPVKPTKDELLDAEVTPFITTANPVFSKVVDGMLDSVPAIVQKFANQGKDQQSAQVLQAIGTQQAQMNNWVDQQIIKNNVSPDAAVKIRAYYNAPFENMKGLTGAGDFSSFSTTAAAMKRMNDTGQMDFRTGMPTVAKIKDAGGDQAVAAMMNVFTGLNSPVRVGMENEMNSFVAGVHPATVLANGASAMKGGQGAYQVHAEQNPDVQRATLKGLVGTFNAYTQKPATLTPTESNAFGNIATQITNLGLQSNDPDNLKTAAGLVSSPAALATFDNYAKDPTHANQVPVVAQGMIALNTKALMRNIPAMLQGGPSNTIEYIPLVNGAMDGRNALHVVQTAAFNPVTGKIEAAYSATDTKGKPHTLTSAELAGVLQRSDPHRLDAVTSANRTLDAIAHLAPNGVGREKDFKPLELRQLLATGSGLPVKSGMQPIPMPSFMAKAAPAAAAPSKSGNRLPPAVADAQMMQESGGQSQAQLEASGAASNQGAVGPFQIRPENFPQYDAQRLRGDNPADFAYAQHARDEIMSELLAKHHGNNMMALAEYHGGPNQKLWGPKTFQYASKIIEKATK